VQPGKNQESRRLTSVRKKNVHIKGFYSFVLTLQLEKIQIEFEDVRNELFVECRQMVPRNYTHTPLHGHINSFYVPLFYTQQFAFPLNVNHRKGTEKNESSCRSSPCKIHGENLHIYYSTDTEEKYQTWLKSGLKSR